jgi:PAS domain S-box-containing protein
LNRSLERKTVWPNHESQIRARRGIDWSIARLDWDLVVPLTNLLVFELAFFCAYKYAMNLSLRTGAPFWFPDSVLLCALLLSGPRKWWIYIVATLPIRLLVALPAASPTWFLLAAFANDSLKAVLAAALVRRTLPDRGIRFDSLHDFWIYLLATAVFAPALSGIAGAASWVALGREFWPTWRNWFLGDALANIVLTPLLLCMALGWRRLGAVRPVRYLEGLVVFAGLVLAVQIAHQQGLQDPNLIDFYHYIPASFLMLAAVRFGPPGAAGSLSIMSMLSVAATEASQRTIFVPAAMDSVLSIQLFMIVLAIPIMSLAVLVEQQHKTGRSLRESEERFRNMADTAPVMIWISGVDERANFFNRGWLNFTGRSLSQEIGYGWTTGVHPDQRDGCLAKYSAAFESRRDWHTEYQLRRADGEYRWMLCSGGPRFAQGGEFEGYIVSCFDITDFKNAQESALARQKLESLGVLAAGIAHDFNNLLGSIHAEAELAEVEIAEGSRSDREIQAIKRISIRASEIVRQLMIYSGHDKPDFEPLDVSKIVGEMLELLNVSTSKHASLKVDLADDLPAVMANGSQIRQVVMNLVINASDALANRGGEIRVSTSLATGGPNSALRNGSTLPPGDYVMLRVSDTGAGMTKEAQTRIFEPFFTTKLTGRGLGLPVVHGIVGAHHGTIDLVSAPGEGTTFHIYLPCIGQPHKMSHRHASN